MDCDGSDCELLLVITGELDNAKWIEILNKIAEKGKPAHLDLNGCTVPSTASDGSIYYSEDGIHGTFDPRNVTEGEDGKALIKTLKLPEMTFFIPAGTADNYAFKDFTKLQSITGNRVVHVRGFAFYNLKALEEVDFPNVDTILTSAFEGCVALKEVDFPNVAGMDTHVFVGCINLKTVNLPKYFWVDGDERRAIHPSLFEGCSNLESIDIPLITFIHPGTFKGLTNLKTVKFDNLTVLEPATFIDCINLESVSMPLITTIYEGTFKDLTNLKTVDFPNVTVIGDEAFMGCTNLSSISFPKVEVINPNAFAGCTSLIEVSFPSATRIYEGAFKNCTSLTTAIFHAEPEPTSYDAPFNGHPLGPWLENHKGPHPGGHFTNEIILFAVDAFRGCVNLEVLDVRNAWNVYFGTGALADIGNHLDIYLYDDIGKPYGGNKSFGHPQLEPFLGGTWGEEDTDYSTIGVSLESINIYLPNIDSMMVDNVNIYTDGDSGGNPDDLGAGYRGIEASIIAIYNHIFNKTHGNSVGIPAVNIISPIPE